MRKNFWDTEHFKKKIKEKSSNPTATPKKYLKPKPKKHREYHVGEFIIFIVSIFLIGVFCYFSYIFINNFFRKKVDKIEPPKTKLETSIFESETKDWQAYDNISFHYQIKLPGEAKKSEMPTGEGANFTFDETEIKVWAENNEIGDTINIAIETQRLEAESKVGKIKVIETRDESLSGQTALSQIWNYYDQTLKKDINEKMVIAAANSNLYFIDFKAPIKEFEQKEKTFDLIIQSLKIF